MATNQTATTDRQESVSIQRNRLAYVGFVALALLAGLASRRFFGGIPFIGLYAGDVLWALMVFFGFCTLLPGWPAGWLALVTLLFSFGIEASQLIHEPWLEAIRATRLGGLILGFSFVWSDLLCYSLGALIGYLMDAYLMPGRYRRILKR
ncbi:ribosomal maturation YjgA family protein [Spirosoma sordidisoli]|uniref:ribosomal maturation YjgA family protein n=1 Tax=Spirosoma sordidisoli TaxID=2502893 RepID=UPI0019D082BD|nr:DUF2809 domain-containing protein [Spirosoma sordidisoli]